MINILYGLFRITVLLKGLIKIYHCIHVLPEVE